MPAGMPYFAWIDPGETVFGPEHMRWDEQVFSFTLQQDEGDPASLTLVVRRPRNAEGNPIGLLGPGRKIWAWFAFDCGPDLVRFRGRLVGIPTSIFEELVTLEFVARPADLVTQKNALADSLRVLPYYDEALIDPPKRTDPDVVLEGYSKIWHYDRESHVLTVSDEITGEDGLVEFDASTEDRRVFYDGLGLTLTSGPLTRVDVQAEFTWTQQAQGNVDLTRHMIDNWPGSYRGIIQSFSFAASNWVKTGGSLGSGWVAADASVTDLYPDPQTKSETSGSTLTVRYPDTSWFGPSSHTTTYTETVTTIDPEPPGSVYTAGPIEDNITVKQSPGGSTSGSSTYTSSYSRNVSMPGTMMLRNHFVPTLVAGYAANRQCTELVSFSLWADVQPIMTDPEDGEALLLDDIRSVNLSEPINGVIPIEDARRRSYIATERGNRSLEHLICVARAHLMRRSRVVEIAVAPKLARMPEITLRKNAFLIEPRVGEALGKIIGYSISLDGNDGRVACEVRIGCAIGYGGSQVETEGVPTYAAVDYVGADYQQFEDRVVMFSPLDTSVGYQPPNANPNDDGLNFMSPLYAEDVIEVPLVVTDVGSIDGEKPETATLKLKNLTREFSSDYQLQVTDLKIPTGYDLEAV